MNQTSKIESENIRTTIEIAYHHLKLGEYGIARDLFVKHFNDRDPDIANQLGYIYQQKNFSDYDLSKSIEYYTIAANAGNMYAQHALGSIFRDKGDIKKAISWMEKASSAGAAECSYILFHHYLKANNAELADTFLRRAVDQGHPPAKQRLAIRSILGFYGWKKVIPGLGQYFSNIGNLINYTKNLK